MDADFAIPGQEKPIIHFEGPCPKKSTCAWSWECLAGDCDYVRLQGRTPYIPLFVTGPRPHHSCSEKKKESRCSMNGQNFAKRYGVVVTIVDEDNNAIDSRPLKAKWVPANCTSPEVLKDTQRFLAEAVTEQVSELFENELNLATGGFSK